MEPIAYLKALQRRWRVVAACVLVALVVAWVTTPATTSTSEPLSRYETTVTLVPPVSSQASVNLNLAVFLVTQLDVSKIAATKLSDGSDPVALASSVRATTDPDIGSVNITATDSDKVRAGAIAEAFAFATVKFLRDSNQRLRDDSAVTAKEQLDRIERAVKNLTDEVDRSTGAERLILQGQLATEQTRYGIAYQRYQDLTQPIDAQAELQRLGTAKTIDVSPAGISPPDSRRGRLLLVGLLGVLLGLVAALVVDRMDVRLRSREAAEAAFDAPVVAEIPRAPRHLRQGTEVAILSQPGGAVAEGYRTLRSAVLRGPLDMSHVYRPDGLELPDGPQVILVTSARSRDGKTTTIANLAAALAEAERSVLVLDCDLRNPEIHRRLGVAPGLGLAELAGEDQSEALPRVIRPSAAPGVGVVTAGKAVLDNPAALLLRIGAVIEEARRHADIVLIDSAPLLVANDTNDLLQYVDAVVLCARVGHVSAEQAGRVRQIMARFGKPVIGLALVGVPTHPQLPSRRTSSSLQTTRLRVRVPFVGGPRGRTEAEPQGMPPRTKGVARQRDADPTRGPSRHFGEPWGTTEPGA